MKLKQAIVLLALFTIFYACGTRNGNSNSSNVSDTLEVQETAQKPVSISALNQNDIQLLKYNGKVGDKEIHVELSSFEKDKKGYSIYMYKDYNSPLLLKKDTNVAYIKYIEQFPDKTKKGKYKNGGLFIFKNAKDFADKLKGEYVNPSGTETYPLTLQVTEIVTSKQEEAFEELQEYKTSEHYFTILSNWVEGSFSDTIRSVKQINVYDKQSGKKLQSLPVPFGKNYSFAVVESTNTNPEGIQIGCNPDGIINPNGYSDYIAYFPDNGKYVKDTLVCGREKYERGDMYRKYNENGDIVESSSYSEQESYYNIIYVTTEKTYEGSLNGESVSSENIVNNLFDDQTIITRFYETYTEAITLKPVYSIPDSEEKPFYIKTVRTDNKSKKVLSSTVKQID